MAKVSKKKINLIILGIEGKMGKSLLDLFLETNRSNHPNYYQILAGVDKKETTFNTIPIFNDFSRLIESIHQQKKKVDFIVDFSNPKLVMKVFPLNTKFKIPIIIGTTGFTPIQEKKIKSYSQFFPIIKSGNFSLGINVMLSLIKQIQSNLEYDYDIEIVEHHHNQKKDAPSGTAKMILQQVKEMSSFKQYITITKREGNIGKRKKKEIGVFALRGGGTIGEHKLYFFSENDKLEINHTAFNRRAFTSGVIRSIIFLQKKKAKHGLFSMQDVLEK